MAYSLSSFPAQKKPHSSKTQKWRKDCVDGAEAAAVYSDDNLRKSRRNKTINYNLYSNILDQQDVEQICNPLKLKGFSTPIKMQNYPLCNPKIDVLIGEEATRGFEYRVRVINEDAISDKENSLKEEWRAFVMQRIQEEATSEEELQRKVAEFQRYALYDFQDLREQRATWILKDIEAKNNLNRLFNKGFKDALLVSEEIYEWDVIGGEPICKRLNPKNVYTVRSGESPYIEDADIIVIEEYYSIGQVIDEYHDDLTESQINHLERNLTGTDPQRWMTGDYSPSVIGPALKVDEAIDEALIANNIDGYSGAFDTEGNVRVLRVRWKSMRKVLKVKYYDEDGNEQSKLMDENYTPNAELGEESETIWISEWWEGHKIAGSQGYDPSAIYTRIRPRPMQFRQMSNPSKCHPGVVGTIYNTNDNKGISLMDRMKPYQYLYNVIWYNTELLIATNWGKIMKIPLHEMPDGWEEDQWLYFAKYMKAVPYDAFKEGKKGAATGKLAGNMNTQSPVLDMEMGNSLQFYMLTLQYIEQKMGEIAGISPQRMGAVQNRETLGGVERSVTQSSMITEYWFAEHDFLKKRVLEVGLETAKYAFKGKKHKVQFAMDDFVSKIAEIDGDDFAEADYGLVISSSWKDKQAFDSIRQLAQSALQGGLMDFGQLLDLWTSDSVSAMRKKFQISEKAKKDLDAQKAEQASKQQQEMIAAQQQEKEADRQFQAAMEDKKAANAITLEKIKRQLEYAANVDADKDGIPDEAEMMKIQSAERMKAKELETASKEAEKDRKHESTENAKDREVERAKIAAQKSKPKAR